MLVTSQFHISGLRGRVRKAYVLLLRACSLAEVKAVAGSPCNPAREGFGYLTGLCGCADADIDDVFTKDPKETMVHVVAWGVLGALSYPVVSDLLTPRSIHESVHCKRLPRHGAEPW